MIRKILLAYDGSENSRRALDLAAELAAKLDAGLMITHVLMHGRPPEELVRMAEVENLLVSAHEPPKPELNVSAGQVFERFAATKDYVGAQRVISSIGDQLISFAKTRSEELGVADIQTSIHVGDYAEEILEAADDYQADMIVMGSRGLGTLKGAVLGSVSLKVLHNAAQTVVAVK